VTVAFALVAGAAASACGGSSRKSDEGATAGDGGSAAGGRGGGAAGGGAGSGGAGSGSTGDCTRDSDCSRGRCVELTVGGYRVCAAGPIEATECPPSEPGPFENECCNSTDCSAGELCVGNPNSAYCGGPAIPPYNSCATNACDSSEDCEDVENGACFPAGFAGFPVATCIAGACRVDADCAGEPAGRCLLVETECCRLKSLACVYPDGCRSLADCPDESLSCRVVGGRAVCSPEPVECPL
jgi:hypothetical protein